MDLFANVDDGRLLVEAKSLNDVRRAVDRMRYGMGQLFDYRMRYRPEIGDAQPILAFGSPPPTDAGIAEILDANGVSFISSEREQLIPLNTRARDLPLFR
jgi:hypothetical protein